MKEKNVSAILHFIGLLAFGAFLMNYAYCGSTHFCFDKTATQVR